jgi:hypothetical protein
MQAASLFAFGDARQVSVAAIAMVSNAVDHSGKQFDSGSREDGYESSRESPEPVVLSSRLSDLLNLAGGP